MENVNLEAWDSIADHHTGLTVLARIFQTGRRKQTTEPLTTPYRNGILHGVDLGYDNQMVATKTWAALFAIRDWALKAEQDLLAAPPEPPQRSWGDLLQQMRENANEKRRLGSVMHFRVDSAILD